MDPSEDYFNWKIETRSPIEPNNCTFKLNAFKLELKLFKTVIGSWESLEAPGFYLDLVLNLFRSVSYQITFLSFQVPTIWGNRLRKKSGFL